MRIPALASAITFCAAMLHADVASLVDQVISRATDLAGPSFQSCGEITTDAAEDCFLYAYKHLAQLLVDARGHVPEVQMILVPSGCSGKAIESILKRWRYSPPKKDGKPIATVEVIEISFKK
jgi:hypothetical protein